MLELGWKKSRSNAQIQLMLLKIYGELGEKTFACVLYIYVVLLMRQELKDFNLRSGAGKLVKRNINLYGGCI